MSGAQKRHQKNDKKSGDLAYYLTLFKLEGHTTWRAFLGNDKGAFDRQWELQTEGKKPKITERQVLRIDRITGAFAV